MKKKLVSVLLTAAMGVSLLAGCGAQDATDVANQAASAVKDAADQAASAVAENAGDVTANADAIANLIAATTDTVSLQLWCSETEQYQTVMKDIVEKFKAEYSAVNFDITIGAVSEADAKDRVLEDVEAAADVFVFADDQIEELVKAGALNEVQATYTYDVAGSNTPAAVEAAKVDGKLYAYPFTASNGYFLYYNSDVLSAEDVASWEALTAKADELGKKVGMEVSGAWYLYGFFAGAGCTLTENEDGSNNCDWNSETGVAVAESIMNICAQKSFYNLNNDNALAELATGDLIAFVSGTWNTKAFEEAYGTGYAAAKLPTFDVNGTATQMGSYSGYKFVGVNSYSKNVGWAMLLAEFISNAQSQEAVYEATGEGPANTEALAKASSPALDALAAQSAYADLQRVGGAYWDPAAALGQNLVEGVDNIQQVLDDAVAGITQPVQQ